MKYYVRIQCKSGYKYKDNMGNILKKQKLFNNLKNWIMDPFINKQNSLKQKKNYMLHLLIQKVAHNTVIIKNLKKNVKIKN